MHDRIYGKIELPDSARRLAESCPLLLRLREVRMPNIPFYGFPSFANVSRYEHSIGVAHLTWWWARRNKLGDDAAEAVTLAGLYHDAATPAFSHLFEEFLSRRGFDHELALADILGARPSIAGGSFAQVFLGGHCKLRQELGSRARSNSLLSATGVARLVMARHPLGVAVHGDLDLDNIDNVIRAVTAMGIASEKDEVHPYEVAEALVWDGEQVGMAPGGSGAIGRWRSLRRRLYGAILGSEREFVAQATIKWAIEECYKDDSALRDESAWTLTEPELVQDHLRKHPSSRELIDRIRLGQPARILLSAWFDDVSPLMGDGNDKVTQHLCERFAEVFRSDVYLNFYVDKRERDIRLPVIHAGTLFDSLGDFTNNVPTKKQAHRTSYGNDRLSEGGPAAAAGVRGVVGVVGLRPAAGTKLQRQNRLARSSEIFREILGQSPKLIDTSWLGVESLPSTELRVPT